ncbi:MAG: hypothetical protein CV087_09670 [Candidatus Brocadia sp. WS118]|nr:MAG: hypothetical protein CV087_09670 [Candidatus Brocadia sp. WS118]
MLDLAFASFQSYLGYSVFDFLRNPLIQVVVYGVFFISLLWRNSELESEITEIKSQQANIVAGEVMLELPFPIFVKGIETETFVERYYLELRNIENKKVGKLVNSGEVHAIVNFYDKSMKHMPQYSHEKPFWLNSKPPYEIDRTKGNLEISASGKPQGLHLVARKQGDEDLYVFSQNSYDISRKSFSPFQEKLKLVSKKYFISIEVKSENGNMSPVWFSLSNRGAEKEPKFEKLSSVPKPATQQSVHLTGGILRRFRAFFKPRKNPVAKRTQRPPTRK